MLTTKKFLGFSIPELMIALVLSSILSIALIAAFVANANHYQKVLNTNRLNHQLEVVLEIMSNDIRRAGYWANANSDVGLAQNNNPFMASGNDITINASNDCILFTYDHGSTGTLPAISAASDDYRYGFRLSGGIVQTRPPGAEFSCTGSSWENMTDANVTTITALTFTLNARTVTTGPGSRGVMMRSIDITLTGQLASDATVTKTLTQHVRIRNDKFIP